MVTSTTADEYKHGLTVLNPSSTQSALTLDNASLDIILCPPDIFPIWYKSNRKWPFPLDNSWTLDIIRIELLPELIPLRARARAQKSTDL